MTPSLEERRRKREMWNEARIFSERSGTRSYYRKRWLGGEKSVGLNMKLV